MASTAKPDDKSFLNEPEKLPGMINVLTILTFIGSGIFALLSLYSFFNAREGYESLIKAQDKMDQMPAFAKRFMTPEMIEASRIAMENRIPIFILSFLGYGFCVYGAIQMRQRKKVGFYTYAIGELPVPLVTAFLFMSSVSYTGLWSIVGYIIFTTFIVLYATQLKYLR